VTDGRRLSFLADVHVPRAIVHAMSGAGFDVSRAPNATDDRRVLEQAAAETPALITNDRDFTALHGVVDHAGIVMYSWPPESAGAALRGIRRIDRQFSPSSMENTLLWLEDWL